MDSIIRAATLPVASVEGAEWADFIAACNASWAMTTRLANWAVRRLFLADRERKAKDKKLAAAPKLYLYGLLKGYHDRAAWDGCAASASSLLRAVEKKYRACRLETLWTYGRSVMSFRWGVPFPVHNACYSLGWSEDGRKAPLVTLNLPGGKFTLRLRCGTEFARQIAQFRQLESGAAKRCEAAVYSVGASANTGRRKGEAREPGGGNRRPFTVMLKLVGRFPRPAAKEGRTMLLCRDPDAFLVGEIEGQGAFVLNADQAGRWQAEHAAFLRRIAQDLKFERRIDAAAYRAANEHRERRCDKHRRRLSTFCQQAAAQACGWAARHGVAHLIYDDAARGALPSFPWHEFKSRLASAAEAGGLGLVVKSDDTKRKRA